MGVIVEEPDETSFVVRSTGRLAAPAEPLFLGNAGTATRFLTAAVALCDGMVVVDGDEHMRKRPIGPLVTALRQLGITASAPTGCPPVMVEGRGNFGAGRVEIDGGLSSQYVSALLMAAPYGDGADRCRAHRQGPRRARLCRSDARRDACVRREGRADR